MPTYRYECQKCGVVHEFFHGMTETRKKCPECRGKLERLIGAGGGVLLKGGGFHNTDYRSESYKKAEKSERDAAKESGGTASGDSKKSGAEKGPAKKTGGASKKPATSEKKKRKG